jgi:hypothetical protein
LDGRKISFHTASRAELLQVRTPMQIKEYLATLTFLALFFLASSASSQIIVTGTNQTGSVPFTPAWTAASASLISGLVPTVANGNFGEYTGANANNLAKPGIPLTIYAYSSVQATNLEVCGNDGTAGSLLVYTLPAATYGQTSRIVITTTNQSLGGSFTPPSLGLSPQTV